MKYCIIILTWNLQHVNLLKGFKSIETIYLTGVKKNGQNSVVCQYINTFATLGHRLPALDTLTTCIISHSKQLFLNMLGIS